MSVGKREVEELFGRPLAPQKCGPKLREGDKHIEQEDLFEQCAAK